MRDRIDGNADALAYRPRTERPARLMPWSAVQHGIDALAVQIRAAGISPDAVVGIFQGGWIIAQCLADHFPAARVLGVLARLDDGLRGELVSAEDGVLHRAALPPGAVVVLADEVIDSGRTAGHFAAVLRDDFGLRVLVACLVAASAADPAPDFAANQMDDLPELVLPWRVQRDFLHAMVCLLRACPLTTAQIDERLRELGHDISPDILDRRLRGLAASGYVVPCSGGRWGLADRRAPR